MEEETDRKDFISYLLQEQATKDLSAVQLAAHGSILCEDFTSSLTGSASDRSRIAGSETTATTLAVVSYFLSQNPPLLKKLQAEVRGAFKYYNEINGTSTAGLKYLHAVCLEALRVFPPLPLALPA